MRSDDGRAEAAPRDAASSRAEEWLDHHIHGFEALERLNDQARMPMHFRPTGREAPQVDIGGIRAPRLAIWSVQSSTGFESVPSETLDLYSIRVPLRGGVLRRTGSREFETLAGTATILPASDILATRFHPGSDILNCSVGASDLRARCDVLEADRPTPLHLLPLARVEGPRLRGLVHTIRQIGDHLGTPAAQLTGPLLMDLLLNQILTAWPRGNPPVVDTSSRIADKAVDFIEAHLAEPLTVGSVAAATGVGLRTLQSAFRARTGRTPLGYILDRRLESAHLDLLANEGRLPVSQIAYRWGFLHMGEFARRYRERYGQPPSQTGRRSA
ncbi:AraC family transcriptional regulator [uncultured Aureimonas sp.]|uniref:AraC family transcriptional regulator n=1 Tax=uncultured Aureimonas sp. TaxID=1604662 RepID=UPI0025DDA1E0|nr:AraC family transcriptional regulator [uncultured Aureimonas sp.]